MKKTINIALICVLCLMLFGCSARKATNKGYALYRSSPVGVEIEYPDFWEVVDDKNERTVAFATPNEGFADTYRDNVTIVCEEIGEEDLAFDAYVTDYIKQLPSAISGYNKLSENELTVGQCRAYRVMYEGKTNEGDLRLQQTFIQSGKYMFIYSFIAEPASYEYFSQNSDIMLSTFKPLRK